MAVQQESKLPSIKAKVITKLHGDQKDNKNAYVLLRSPEQASEACEKLNQTHFMGKHIRVDIDFKEEGYKSNNDFETTIFIGNLPFIVNEENVREHIVSAFDGKNDPILNVRLIRDPQSFIGKGIGYIQFNNKESMRHCIDELNDKKFMGRPLRMKKAVEPKRLEKKKRRTEEKRQRRGEESAKRTEELHVIRQ